MTTYQRTETRCDFCGHTSAHSRDFRRIDHVDLCHWCANPGKYREMSSGGHTVTFRGGGGWDCDCGVNTDEWRVQSVRILTTPRALAVLPSFDNATARLHTEGRIA